MKNKLELIYIKIRKIAETSRLLLDDFKSEYDYLILRNYCIKERYRSVFKFPLSQLLKLVINRFVHPTYIKQN